MSKPAAVLWDMDGTLVDTEPYWIAAEIELVERAGGVWTKEDGLQLVGLPLLKSASLLQERGGLQQSKEEIVTSLLSMVIERMTSQGIPWQEGAQELLSTLKSAEIPCALVTMSYTNLAAVMIDSLPVGTFSAVVTGDMVAHGKPHPEPYLTAASLLNVDISHCVAIEDSPSGVASAEAAGARTVAVPHMIELPAAPGRSRIPTLTSLDLPVLSRIAAGEVIDLLKV